MKGKKIPVKTKELILERIQNGEKMTEISEDLGISLYTIKNIKSRELSSTSIPIKEKKLPESFKKEWDEARLRVLKMMNM